MNMNKWIIAGALSLAAVGLCAQAKEGKKHSQPVAPASYAEVMAKYDTSKDGKLDDAEKAVMPEKAKKHFEAMMAKCDTNKDGMLDDAEKAAIKGKHSKKAAPTAPIAPTTPAVPAAPVAPTAPVATSAP